MLENFSSNFFNFYLLGFILGLSLIPLFFFGYNSFFKIIPLKSFQQLKSEIFNLNFFVIFLSLIMIFISVLFVRPTARAVAAGSAVVIKPTLSTTGLVFSIRPTFGLNLANQEKIVVKSNTSWQLELENLDDRLWGQNLKVSVLYPTKTTLKSVKVASPSLVLNSSPRPTPNNGVSIIVSYPIINPNVKFTLHNP